MIQPNQAFHHWTITELLNSRHVRVLLFLFTVFTIVWCKFFPSIMLYRQGFNLLSVLVLAQVIFWYYYIVNGLSFTTCFRIVWSNSVAAVFFLLDLSFGTFGASRNFVWGGCMLSGGGEVKAVHAKKTFALVQYCFFFLR